jgi:hypothetical protein
MAKSRQADTTNLFAFRLSRISIPFSPRSPVQGMPFPYRHRAEAG